VTVLKRGSTGEAVRRVQEILGLDVDGIYGASTEAAVMAHQDDENLPADGVAGPDTLATLGLWSHIVLQEGSRGLTVKKLQAALGLPEDGVYSASTRRAVMAFQREVEIPDDGIVGPATLHHLNLFT
jgi:peptidoglycan hydrolase-like protein with peptidoglycan-binding domain